MDSAPYLLNAWYMAAWSSEVGETPLRRRLLHRLEDGQAAALIDEAGFHNLDGADFRDAGPVFLGVDAGGTRARRLLQKPIEQEREAS